jgi:hypothetical protein
VVRARTAEGALGRVDGQRLPVRAHLPGGLLQRLRDPDALARLARPEPPDERVEQPDQHAETEQGAGDRRGVAGVRTVPELSCHSVESRQLSGAPVLGRVQALGWGLGRAGSGRNLNH